jgi:protein-disulfide isomerase
MITLKVPVSSQDHIQGNHDAAITVVEYGDYECPFCGKAYFVIKQLQKHYGKQLRFVFRNFPLTEMHRNAGIAAEAAEFANEHKLFWEMHDRIYENQENLNLPFLLELGGSLGLPVDKLNDAIVNKKYEAKIQNDFMGGVRSGVNGTPTFYINDIRYSGAFDLESLVGAIESLQVK